MSLWAKEKHCTQAASAPADLHTLRWQVGMQLRENEQLFNLNKRAHVFCCYLCLVHLSYRAIFDDQAPHLVYLTSCVWHSVSVSVSLSNTPSEVSLVSSSDPPILDQSTDRAAGCTGWCTRHHPANTLTFHQTVEGREELTFTVVRAVRDGGKDRQMISSCSTCSVNALWKILYCLFYLSVHLNLFTWFSYF